MSTFSTVRRRHHDPNRLRLRPRPRYLVVRGERDTPNSEFVYSVIGRCHTIDSAVRKIASLPPATDALDGLGIYDCKAGRWVSRHECGEEQP